MPNAAMKRELEHLERCMKVCRSLLDYGPDKEVSDCMERLSHLYWALNTDYLFDLEQEARALCRLHHR